MPESTDWASRAQLTGTVDFTMMFAAHDAFTRDLLVLQRECERGEVLGRDAVATWDRFKHYLHVHHTAEDTELWPPLRQKLTRGEDIDTMDAMELEHASIDPQLDRVDAALAARDAIGAAQHVTGLLVGLSQHMRHEERAALPLVETYLGPEGWADFGRALRKSQGLRGGARYLPWLLEDAPPATQAAVFGQLPRPARVLYHRVWAPRYRRATTHS